MTKTTAGLRSGEHHGTSSECSECGQIFCGLQPFEQHRVGAPGTPARRCLTEAEIVAQGFARCSVGRWSSPTSLATRSDSVKATAGRIGGRARAENARLRRAS